MDRGIHGLEQQLKDTESAANALINKAVMPYQTCLMDQNAPGSSWSQDLAKMIEGLKSGGNIEDHSMSTWFELFIP